MSVEQRRAPEPAGARGAITGRIDVHGHFLPGIDDGCADYADSIKCAKMLVGAGYTHAFCTPHVWPNLPGNNVREIARRVIEFQQKLIEEAVPLRVMPGGELNLVWVWPALEKGDGEVVTYGLKGEYVLFDFWAAKMAECSACLEAAIVSLQERGFKLIMAHPERVAALHADEAAVGWFVERGVLLQLNTWCLTDPPETPTFRMARRLLMDGKYFLMGTDTHNARSMPNRIRGVEVAEKMVGAEIVEALTITNPRKLLPAGAWAEWGEVGAGLWA